MMDITQWSDTDSAYVNHVEAETAAAMEPRDPIDQYQALQKVIDENPVSPSLFDRMSNAAELHVSTRNALRNEGMFVQGACLVFSVLGFIGACSEILLLTSLITSVAGIGGFLVAEFIYNKIEGAPGRVYDEARKALLDLGNKLGSALEPATKQRDFLKNEPQVAEYLELKKNKKLSDPDIRAAAAKKFLPKTVTPDDLTVTLPESGAAKPRIRLKGF